MFMKLYHILTRNAFRLNGYAMLKKQLMVLFEEDTSNKFEKQSPTTSKDSLHVILSTIASKKWPLKATDTKTAFLQGEKIIRKVYLTPPSEAHIPQSHVWLLKKCVCSLTDALLMWYKRVQKFVIDNVCYY